MECESDYGAVEGLHFIVHPTWVDEVQPLRFTGVGAAPLTSHCWAACVAAPISLVVVECWNMSRSRTVLDLRFTTTDQGICPVDRCNVLKNSVLEIVLRWDDLVGCDVDHLEVIGSTAKAKST